jgi:cytochrome c551/c552
MKLVSCGLILLNFFILFACKSNREEPQVIDYYPSEARANVINEEGENLFKQNCAACHSPTDKIVGPPFQQIRKDYTIEWINSFIRSSGSLIKKKDVRAEYIFGIYNKIIMPGYALDDSDIVSILNYVDEFPYNEKMYAHRKLNLSAMRDSVEKWHAQNTLRE